MIHIYPPIWCYIIYEVYKMSLNTPINNKVKNATHPSILWMKSKFHREEILWSVPLRCYNWLQETQCTLQNSKPEIQLMCFRLFSYFPLEHQLSVKHCIILGIFCYIIYYSSSSLIFVKIWLYNTMNSKSATNCHKFCFYFIPLDKFHNLAVICFTWYSCSRLYWNPFRYALCYQFVTV
jgi:hypothetical protein